MEPENYLLYEKYADFLLKERRANEAKRYLAKADSLK